MKNKIFTYILLLVFFFVSSIYITANPLNTDQISEIVHSTQRVVVPLSGSWERSVDAGGWRDVYIPFTDYSVGVLIYQKEFNINKDFIDSKNIRLLFLGLNGQVEILVNNEFITKTNGNLIPLDINIPKKVLVNGKNEIKLVFQEATNLEKQMYTSMIASPKFSRGILRDVFLIGTSNVYINEVKYKFYNNNTLNVNLSCAAGQISEQILDKDEIAGKIASKKVNVTAEYQIINKNTGIALTPIMSKNFNVEISRIENVNFSIDVSNMNYWTPTNPDLYSLIITLKQDGEVIDKYFSNVARKFLSVKNNNFELNDVPIQLNIITYNEYFGTTKHSLSAYRLEEDIKQIKLLGVNAIRYQYNIPSPYLVYLCEKYGLLLFIDLPLKNTTQSLFMNSEFKVQQKNILIQILQNYANSPVFVGIGLGNCAIECPEFTKFSEQLQEIIKNYGKLNYKIIEQKSKNINTEGYSFIGIQLEPQNLNTNEVKQVMSIFDNNYKLPLLLSFGTNVMPNNLNGYSDQFSLDYQAYYIKTHYNLSNQLSLSGWIINSYNDYATQYPQLSYYYWNQNLNTEGITDIYRNPRLSYMTLKTLLNNERQPLLDAGNSESDIPISFVIIGLIGVLILLYMVNRYSRFREYLVRAFWRSFNFFADIRDHRIMSITQTLIIGILIAVGIGLCIAAAFINVRHLPDYNYILTAFFPFNDFLNVLFKLAYQPVLLLVANTLISILVIIIISAIIRLVAFILNVHIKFDNAITMTIWAALPFIILLPIGIVLAKLLTLSFIFYYIFWILFILLLLLTINRILQSIYIVFDINTIKVYSFGIAFLFLVILLPIFFYINALNIFSHISYFIR